MKLTIPWHDLYSQYQIVAMTPAGEMNITVDDSHRAVEIPLPRGVEEADVEVLGGPVGPNGQLIGELSLIQARVERPKRDMRLPRTNANPDANLRLQPHQTSDDATP